MNIKQNLEEIQTKIKASAAKVNRDPHSITTIAVTKFVEIEKINEAIACGITDIAENRVQEGVRKFPLLNGQVVKHLIGSLQTNKVKAALDNFDMIHSVDRIALLEEIAKQAEKMKKPVEILIQLNISGEDSKHGLTPDDLPLILEQLKHYPSLVPSGLMTMAPLVDNPEEVRPIFRCLKELFDKVASEQQFSSDWRFLSMGMSQDYPIAVEEGANLLRIGTAIFKL